MRVLVTGGNGRLAKAAAHDLRDSFTFRLMDTRFDGDVPDSAEHVEADLRDADAVKSALVGVEAVLHLAPLRPEPDPLEGLDLASRGTWQLFTAMLEAEATRIVVGSSLALFNRFPVHWNEDEEWKPLPQPLPEQLAPWIAELGIREGVRGRQIPAICLRFGQLEGDGPGEAVSTRRVSRFDAVDAVRNALTQDVHPDVAMRNWRLIHVETRSLLEDSRADDAENPWDHFAPVAPIPSQPVNRVVLFGAGGPVGVETSQELSSSYFLRLTDARPLAVIAQSPPQSEGAPLPVPLSTPHEERVVDITDPAAVHAACEGMDAIMNLSVVRDDVKAAFRVNTLGAYNLAVAAVEHRIRRVVQTGPQLVTYPGPNGYGWDYDVTEDSPPRPDLSIYAYSKYLGQEILRVFAEHYDLEVPVLLFTAFVNPDTMRGNYLHPFAITWRDSARALRRALEVASLPSPFVPLNILTDQPQRRFSNHKAKAVLDWEPRDRMEHLWSRERHEKE